MSYNYVCYNQVNNGKASQREKMGLETDGYCNEHSVTDWKMEMMAKYFLNEAWKNRKEDLMIALEYIKKYYTDATRNNTQHSELFLDAQIDKAEKKLKILLTFLLTVRLARKNLQSLKRPILRICRSSRTKKQDVVSGKDSLKTVCAI